MDGRAKTVRIPRIKAKYIVSDIQIILKNKPIPLKRYRRIIVNLLHVAIIIPGTKGLFLLIKNVMKGVPPIIGLGNNSKFLAALLYLATMVTSLAA